MASDSLWNKRFFSSTRGQIVTLLRKGGATVDELAGALGLTDNAVRAHLAALERDGLVHQAGVRRGVSKPSFVYQLTRDAQRIFPKADGPTLRHLLDVLVSRLSQRDLREIIDETGEAAASEFPAAQGTLHERVQQSVQLLEEMGGLAEIETSDYGYLIRGFSCPYAATAPGQPAVCQLAAAFLADYIDAPVEARCAISDENSAPRCLFEIKLTEDAQAGISSRVAIGEDPHSGPVDAVRGS